MRDWTGLRIRRERHERESASGWVWQDAVSNAHFRRLEDGQLLFYPAGAFGLRGYIVGTSEQEALLRARAREWRHGLTLLGLLLYVLMSKGIVQDLSWTYAASVAGWWILLLAVEHVIFLPITRHMDRADVANSPVSYWRSLGRSCHPLVLVGQAVFGVIMTGGFFYAFTLQYNWILVAGAILAVATLLVPALIALHSWWTIRNA